LKFYGKRLIRNAMHQVTEGRAETRDGVLWDIGPTIYVADRMCRVKIQGSNEYIHAHYPENWEKIPTWLKPGNAVKIMHTGGVRGRIEIVGHGQMVPTPVSGAKFPTIVWPTSSDGILTGCSVIACETPRMAVLVEVGTYRLSGVTYTLGPITAGNGTNYLASDGGACGDIAGAIAISAAPSAGNYRYDLISVGAHDDLIDLQTGTPAASPVKPTLLTGHIALGYVFVPSGTTEISGGINLANVSTEFADPVPTSLLITVTDNDLAWDELTTNVRVSVKDQYGNLIVGSGYGWYIQLQVASNVGTVSSAEEGSSRTIIGGHCGANAYYDFTYTRDQIGSDVALLTATLATIPLPTAFATITLRDYVWSGAGVGTKANPFKINKPAGGLNVYIPENCVGMGEIAIPAGAKYYFEIDPLVTTGLSVSAFKVCVVFYGGAGAICKLTQNKGTLVYSAEVCSGYSAFMEIVNDNDPLEIDDYKFLYAIDNTGVSGTVYDAIWVVMPFVP
jgi:hypothetical protein